MRALASFRPDRSDRSDRSDRPDRSDRSDRSDSPDRPDRAYGPPRRSGTRRPGPSLGRQPRGTGSSSGPATAAGRRWRRARWPLLLGWLVVAVLATPLAGRLAGVTSDTPASSLPTGSQSTTVATMQDRASGSGTSPVDGTVVVSSPSALSTRDLAAVGRLRKAVAGLSLPGLAGPGPVQRSADGRAAVFDLAVTPATAKDTARVSDAVAAVRRLLPRLPRGLAGHVTGDAGSQADGSSAGADSTLLLTSTVVVGLLLLVLYRSLALWLVPLLAAGVATQVARAVAYGLHGAGLTVTSLAAVVLVVLVFGAATDYALLLVQRYRDELAAHDDHHDALAVAVRRTAPALVASAATVCAGLLCLLAASLAGVRGLGPVSAAGIVVVLAVQLTFLPAALAVGGRRLLWPRAPRPSAPLVPRRRVWTAVAALTERRAGLVVAVSVAGLGVLASGLAGLHGSLDPLDQLRGGSDAKAGALVVQAHFRGAGNDPLVVVGPVGADARPVVTAAAGVAGVRDAVPGALLLGRPTVTVSLADAPHGKGQAATVRALRSRLASGHEAWLVGGNPAVDADYRSASHRDIAVVLPLVLLAVGVVLVLLLRALVAPLLLLAATSLSFAASWGASTWLFGAVFGFHGVEDDLTIFVFVFLVALGVDYTVFLVTRLREERRQLRTGPAMRRSLVATGGVITAAAVVLAATFATLAQLPSVSTAEVGVGVAVGVLLDAVAVRGLLVPAAVHLLGERVWWPARPPVPVPAAAGLPVPRPEAGPEPLREGPRRVGAWRST